LHPLTRLALAEVDWSEVNRQQFAKAVEDLELGEHLVVKVGVGKRHDHFFFDLALIVNEIVMSETLIRTLSDKTLICTISDTKSMDSSRQ
jgi:hypothetical protein